MAGPHDPLPAPDASVPAITTAQMREVDRLAERTFGVGLVQMMENAGRSLAHLARVRFLDGEPSGRRVVVLAGRGGNGGGGLACARRLDGWGVKAHVFTAAPASEYAGVPKLQLDILTHMGLPVTEEASSRSLPEADLIVDSIIGYSLRGAPTGESAALIRAANEHEAPVLSLDVPSGLDATTGQARDPCVSATATLTLALPKQGLHSPAAQPYVGELYLADIGVPRQLYARPPLQLDVGPVFVRGDILRLR